MAVAQIFVNVGTQRSPTIKFDAHFAEAYTLPDPTLYKGLASKLGLLSADMVIAITQFHAHYQTIKSRLPLLLENKERGYTHSVLNVLIPARTAVTDIVPTLRQMERLLSIGKPAGDPDLGLTASVIEMEEETYAE